MGGTNRHALPESGYAGGFLGSCLKGNSNVACAAVEDTSRRVHFEVGQKYPKYSTEHVWDPPRQMLGPSAGREPCRSLLMLASGLVRAEEAACTAGRMADPAAVVLRHGRRCFWFWPFHRVSRDQALHD